MYAWAAPSLAHSTTLVGVAMNVKAVISPGRAVAGSHQGTLCPRNTCMSTALCDSIAGSLSGRSRTCLNMRPRHADIRYPTLRRYGNRITSQDVAQHHCRLAVAVGPSNASLG